MIQNNLIKEKKNILVKWKKVLEDSLTKGYSLFRIDFWDRKAIDKQLLRFKINEGKNEDWFFDVKSDFNYIDGKLNKDSAGLLEKITPMTTFGIAHIFLFDENKTKVIKFLDTGDIGEVAPFKTALGKLVS